MKKILWYNDAKFVQKTDYLKVENVFLLNFLN